MAFAFLKRLLTRGQDRSAAPAPVAEPSAPEASTPEASAPEASTPELSTPEPSAPKVDQPVIDPAPSIEAAPQSAPASPQAPQPLHEETSEVRAEYGHYRTLLLGMRKKLRVKASASLANDTEALDEVRDGVDRATVGYDQSVLLRLQGRDRRSLADIDHALKKMTDGEFGICEDCEEPISAGRLEARPVTKLCIQCQEEAELELRRTA